MTHAFPLYPAYRNSGVAWLGEIPAHWRVTKLKHLAPFKYGESLAAEARESGSVPVYGSNGVVGVHSKPNTLAPCLVIGRKGSFGKINWSAVPCFAIDTTFFVDPSCANAKTDLRWLFYALPLLGLDALSQDSAVPGLSRTFAHEQWLPDISEDEQRAIAAFLDRETTRLDALIARKERLLALLAEKRAALISHAVTKGLDPSVPMRDSGIAWLGEIPTHWEIAPLRRVIDKFVDYRGQTPEKVPTGIRLITARNIKNGRIDFGLSEEFIREEDYASWMVRGLPEVGDVSVTTEAPLGESAQIEDPYIALAQRIILLKADKSRLTNEYLKYHFASASGTGELWSRATGSTAVGIKASHLRETLITVPPLKEQQAIVEHVRNEVAKLDALAARVNAAIEKLREYRAALISAAVTGKIDVRGEAVHK